jgi:hypothetical protein
VVTRILSFTIVWWIWSTFKRVCRTVHIALHQKQEDGAVDLPPLFIYREEANKERADLSSCWIFEISKYTQMHAATAARTRY